jgi:hypothetical protein
MPNVCKTEETPARFHKASKVLMSNKHIRGINLVKPGNLPNGRSTADRSLNRHLRDSGMLILKHGPKENSNGPSTRNPRNNSEMVAHAVSRTLVHKMPSFGASRSQKNMNINSVEKIPSSN